MILQVQIQALYTPTPVYRTLLLSDEMSFDEFGALINAAFDIVHSESYLFHSFRSNGKEIEDNYIGIDYDNNFFILDTDIKDDEECYLYEWFKKEKDAAIYEVANEEIELQLEIQKITKPNSATEYPVCIAAEGNIFATDKSSSVDIDEINELIELGSSLSNDVLDQLIGEFLEDKPDWSSLFHVADELKKLKPWQYLDDNHIFVVRHPETEELFFCSILGSSDIEYGLSIYRGIEGWNVLRDILNNQVTDDFFYQLNGLGVYFVDRDELEKSDYDLIKDTGLSYRGKHNWIQFRSYEPGFVPWLPNADDVAILITVIQQSIQFVQQCKNGWQFPCIKDPDTFVMRHRDDNGQWIQTIEPLNLSIHNSMQIYDELSEFEMAQIKKKRKNNLVLEFDLFYTNNAVSDFMAERPYFPVLCIAADQNTGMICYHQIISDQKNAPVTQIEFLNFLKQLDERPQAVVVTPEVKDYLEPLAKKLNITLQLSKTLFVLDDFKNHLPI